MNGQRKRAAALVVLLGILAPGIAFGADPGPCREAYLESGLTKQQMAFDHFRHFYADTLCATDDGGLVAKHEGRVPGETR